MGQKGTKPGDRGVVQVVRIIRRVGAAVAACAVLSGCVGGDFDEGAPDVQSTSQVIAETQANPWDLPIEQRPALFDPCTELPVGAVEKGLGGPVEQVETFTEHRPGDLMVCGWRSAEVSVSVLSTWKSRDEYLADSTFTVTDHETSGRAGMRATDNTDSTDRACVQMFFTERGTVWLRVSLIALFREFDGERFADSCQALDQVILPIMEHFPTGDFE